MHKAGQKKLIIDVRGNAGGEVEEAITSADELLTSGMIDALMLSKHEKNRRVDTPHLDIRYTPTDYGFATGQVPKAIKR